jgi:phytol kinase
MNLQLLHLIMFLGCLLFLIGIAEWLHRTRKWKAEHSRKFLHVSGGIMCLLFPYFFNSHWWILALSATSFALLLYTYKKQMLSSVHKTSRKSLGSVLFPIPVYACFLAASIQHNFLLYYLPVCLLTISDTAAEMAGRRWGHTGRSFFNGQKTMAGSLSFFITAVPVSFAWLYFYAEISPAQAITIAVITGAVTAVAEGVTLHGWDNLSVPAACLLILYFVR